MLCAQARERFSPYLDGAISGHEMQAIAAHLDACQECNAEFQSLKSIQHGLASLGALKPPSDLGMRLRLAISHERVRSNTSLLQSLSDAVSLRWNNALRALFLQVSAGLAGAVVLVGGVIFLLGTVAVPDPVMANDEPLGALTSPHYIYSVARPRPILGTHDATIVVEALVNSRGEVYDYTIVSGPEDASVHRQVTDQLLESVFEPAHVFGVPTSGRVVLTFSGISVHA